MTYLLMTRPQEASERFVDSLPAPLRRRLQVVMSPLFEIRPVAAAPDLSGVRGVIFTSSNAVAVASDRAARHDLPCFCLGEVTAARAADAGWPALCMGRDADALVSALLQDRPAGPLLHLRGRHTRGDVAARLSAGGLPCREAVIYDQPGQPLTPAALAALDGPDPVIVPLFSPRSARQFASQHAGRAPLRVVAISEAAAEPVKHLTINDLLIASRPDARAMAQAVATLAG